MARFDGNSDGALSLAEREAVTTISADGIGAASLQGVELFPNLTTLYARDNALTALDVSGNTALVTLAVDGNGLTALDVTHNPELVMTWAGGTIAALDLSQNAKLEQLVLNSTAIASLDLSGNPLLSMLGLSHSQITSLDLSHNPALSILNCNNNRLASLELSQNAALTQLICSGNQLSGLDLTHNPLLQSLWCSDNQLTSLDLSQNPLLELLECKNNALSSLDLSRNAALQALICFGNDLTSLELTACPNLLLAAAEEPAADPDYGAGVSVYRHVYDEWGSYYELAVDDGVRLISAVPPVITTQPVNYIGELNSMASFTVTAEGEGLSYQWQLSEDGGNNFSDYAGYTGTTLRLELRSYRTACCQICFIQQICSKNKNILTKST